MEKIAVLHIGETVTGEAGTILDALYDRVAHGGFVVIDQFADEATRRAVEEFRRRRGVDEPLERVDWSSSFWRKTHPADGQVDARADRLQADRRHAVPLQRPLWVGRLNLTVVVVFYNMKREAAAHAALAVAARTSRASTTSTTRSSSSRTAPTPDQRLGEEFVAELRARVPLPRPRRRGRTRRRSYALNRGHPPRARRRTSRS